MLKRGREWRRLAGAIQRGAVACGLVALVATGGACASSGESAPQVLLSEIPATGEPLAPVVGRCPVDQRHLWSQVDPWSPSGSLLAVITAPAEPEPGSSATASPVEPQPGSSATAPVTGPQPGSIVIIDAGTWTFRAVASLPGATLPAWSPDGRRLAWVELLGELSPKQWPEGFAVHLVENVPGAAAASLTLQAPGARPPFNIVNDARWHDNERLLIGSHSGTAIDVLWLFDAAAGSLRRLTEMTFRYAPGASLVAFEKWRRGDPRRRHRRDRQGKR